ncbi:MAG: DUF5678 domain-containing protein [Dehalococcoidia bacterium]
MAHRFKRGRDERAYRDRRYPELLARYPDEWVAVHEGSLIAHAKHVRDLLQELEIQEIDPRDSRITFLTATSRAISP